MHTAPSRTRRTGTRARVVAGLSALALSLSACATDAAGGDSASAGGESVPAGSDKQAFIDALADMETVELSVQMPATPGHISSHPAESFEKAIEDWSGGKIQVEVVYGSSVAPVTEAIEAISDGRHDFGSVYPVYDPSQYPAHSRLLNSSFVVRHSALVGTLQATAAFTEASYADPEISQELEAAGVHLLLPLIASDASALTCTEERTSLDDLDGALARVAGSVQNTQAEALGMSPVSMSYTEVYEALQRGTVDCTITILRSADIGGYLPLANQVSISPEVGFGQTPIPIGFGQAQWESLPLAAQQLIFDLAVDVYLRESFHAVFQGNKDAINTVLEEGGAVHEFDEDTKAALQEANDEILAQTEGSEVVTEAADKWLTIITEELGYDQDVSYAELGDWYSKDKVDLDPYMDRLREQIFDAHRPS